MLGCGETDDEMTPCWVQKQFIYATTAATAAAAAAAAVGAVGTVGSGG